MKSKTLFVLGISLMVLSACNGFTEEEEEAESAKTNTEENTESNGSTADDSSENAESTETSDEVSSETVDSGLIDNSNNESGWINFEGQLGGNAKYFTTSPIEYDPSKQYELTEGGYIAYYSGENFIQTVQKERGGTIEQVPEADNIRISYHKTFKDKISLKAQ